MRTKLTTLRVSFLLCSLAGCAADADLSERDDLLSDDEAIVDGYKARWAAESVTLDMTHEGGDVSKCSGVLIAPSVVLTAGHCVDFERGKIQVVAPFAPNAPKRSASSWQSEVKRDPNDSDKIMLATPDWGLVFLDGEIELKTYPWLASYSLAAEDDVVTVGRRNDDAVTDTLWATYPTALTRVDDVRYYAPPVAGKGDSGGAVFRQGYRVIVAIQSTAAADVSSTRVDKIVEKIQKAVKAKGCAVKVAKR